jgi:hypothetical protein
MSPPLEEPCWENRLEFLVKLKEPRMIIGFIFMKDNFGPCFNVIIIIIWNRITREVSETGRVSTFVHCHNIMDVERMVNGNTWIILILNGLDDY